MSLERIIQILKSGTIYTDGTWVLVMGGQGAELNTLSSGLAQISIRVENATTLDQAVALIGSNELPLFWRISLPMAWVGWTMR